MSRDSSDDIHEGPDSETVKKIIDLLDTRVRPAVAQDGGDITFQSFEEGVVYLHMQGACAGCPSSTMTLKMGIENLLKHYIPEVTEAINKQSSKVLQGTTSALESIDKAAK